MCKNTRDNLDDKQVHFVCLSEKIKKGIISLRCYHLIFGHCL